MVDEALSVLRQVTAAAFAHLLRQDEVARAAVSDPWTDRGVAGDQASWCASCCC